jgi:hypothetical protein
MLPNTFLLCVIDTQYLESLRMMTVNLFKFRGPRQILRGDRRILAMALTAPGAWECGSLGSLLGINRSGFQVLFNPALAVLGLLGTLGNEDQRFQRFDLAEE